MGKEKKSNEFTVRKIVDVKEDPATGAPLFKVRWQGYRKEDDTWEPIEHLENLKSMYNLFLVNHGYKPLTSTKKLERESADDERDSGSDDRDEPKPKKKMKKDAGYKRITKLPGAKVAPAMVKPLPIQSPMTSTKGIPSAPPKPPSPLKAKFARQSDLPGPTASPAKKLPSNDSDTPSPMKPIEPRPTESLVQTHINFEQQRPPKISPQLPSPLQHLFQGLRPRPPNWDFDRPAKIIGCRTGDNGLEYCVLFTPDPGTLPSYKVVSHEELIAHAPWLFARFFISNHQLALP